MNIIKLILIKRVTIIIYITTFLRNVDMYYKLYKNNT